jgi:hypothetical protein
MGPNVLSVAVELHMTSYHSFGRNDGTSPQRAAALCGNAPAGVGASVPASDSLLSSVRCAGVDDAAVSSAVYGSVQSVVDVPVPPP